MIVLILLLSLSSWGSSPFGNPIKVPISLKRSIKCPDFTGSWKGKCTDNDGKAFEYWLNIMQRDCESINLHAKDFDMFFEIGGTFRSGVSSSQKNFDGDLTSISDWRGKNRLESRISYSGKAREGDLHWIGTSRVEFSKNRKGDLEVKTDTKHVVYTKNIEIPMEFSTTCKYTGH